MDVDMITEFRLGKGRTVRPSEKSEEWIRKYLELTIRLPEPFTEQGFQEALIRAEYLIDNWLGAPETPQIPNFNPEDLMNHQGWKAKKKEDGSYAQGSLSWGWEFADKFSKEIRQVLEKGPITVDKYEFSLNKERSLVSAKKKK